MSVPLKILGNGDSWYVSCGGGGGTRLFVGILAAPFIPL